MFSLENIYHRLFSNGKDTSIPKRSWRDNTLFCNDLNEDFQYDSPKEIFEAAMGNTFDEIDNALKELPPEASLLRRIGTVVKLFCYGKPKTGWKKILQIIKILFRIVKNILKTIIEGLPCFIEFLSAQGFVECHNIITDEKSPTWQRILAHIGRVACGVSYGIFTTIRHLIQPITSPKKTLQHAMEMDYTLFGNSFPFFTVLTCIYIIVVYALLITGYVLASFILGPPALHGLGSTAEPFAAAIKILSNILRHVFDPILQPIFHHVTDEVRVITFFHSIFAARFSAAPIKIAITKVAIFFYHKIAVLVGAAAIYLGIRKSSVQVQDPLHSVAALYDQNEKDIEDYRRQQPTNPIKNYTGIQNRLKQEERSALPNENSRRAEAPVAAATDNPKEQCALPTTKDPINVPVTAAETSSEYNISCTSLTNQP